MDEVEHFIGQLNSDSFPNRRQAAEMLGEFGDERGVKPLMQMLGDNAWQVRNTVVDSLIKIRNKSSISPLVECLRDEDPAIRNSAMSVLNEMSENVMEPLTQLLLNDESEDVRIFSANTLGHTCTEEKVAGLIKGLVDSDENVRYAVAEALGRLRFNQAVIPLIEAMKKEELWSKYSFVAALGLIGDERACPALIEMLDDEVLSYPAIIALGQIGDIEGLFPILSVLEKSQDATVLKACVISLASLEAKIAEMAKVERQGYFHTRILEVFKELESQKLVDVLIQIMQSEDITEVESAIRMLRYIKGDIPLESIFHLLQDERIEEDIRDILVRQGGYVIPSVINMIDASEKEVQSNLIRVLGVLGTEREAEVLTHSLNSPHPEIVCDALKALGMLNAVKQFEKMAKFLDSPDESIRNAAVGGITLLSKRELVGKVEDLTRSDSEYVRRGGYRVLGFIASMDALNFLMDGLTDESGLVRASVIQSIGYAGITNKSIVENDDYYESITSLLLDEDINVRIETVIALSRINHPRLFKHLVRMLDSDESEVRRFAIRAVGRCSIPEAVPKLSKLLNEEVSTDLRIFICTSLGQCEMEEAIPSLLGALDDSASEVVEEAINALRQIGGGEVVAEILDYLESGSWIVRAAILNAVADLNAPSAVEILLGYIKRAMKDTKENLLLRTAIRALGRVGTPEQAEVLISLMDDPSTRYDAFGSLSAIWYRLGGSYDLKGINNPVARRLATSAYAYIQEETVAKEIARLLKDEYPTVRRTAMLALKKVATPSARAAIEKAGSDDPDSWVKKIINSK